MTRRTVHTRTLARRSALALLYSSDITEQGVEEIVETGAYPADDFDVPEYAELLVKGVSEHMDEIDSQLSSTSENWALDRMPVVDRAILRLALYEMLFVEDVPVSVAINEAVELAKAYGGEDDSARFVNGILGRVARAHEAAAAAQAADEAADAAADEVAPQAEAAAETAPVAEAAAEAEAALEVDPAEEQTAEDEEAAPCQ